MASCLYIAGTCSHAECEAWPLPIQQHAGPSTEDYCAQGGHGWYGDDGDHGRCYCGRQTYPLGGPTPEQIDGKTVVT